MDPSVRTFSDALQKELPNVKAVIHFGKASRSHSKEGDIDVLVIIDDPAQSEKDFFDAYEIITQKLVKEHNKDIHLTTMLLSQYWHYLKIGDPIITNILRDGIIVFDIGIFKPMQKLFYKGQIKPTKEAMWYYFLSSQATLKGVKLNMQSALLDMYWSMTDATLACAMAHQKRLYKPQEAETFLNDLVKQKRVRKETAQFYSLLSDTINKIYEMKIAQISGKEYDQYLQGTKQGVQELRDLTEKQLAQWQ